MDFRILGPLEALDGTRPVALGGRRRRAVLGALLLHPNETLSNERLIDELWGESPPANALKTLQVNVSRLRKSLPEEVLVTRGHGYELRVGPEELDARRTQPPRAAWSAARVRGYDAGLHARRAGMLGVGLLSGGYGEDELSRAGAFRVYRDIAELRRSLDDLGIVW